MNMKFDLPKTAMKQLANIWNDHILDTSFWHRTEGNKFLPFPIAVFAMANDVNLGYYLAVTSRMNHRIPHRLWAERVCNGPIQIVNAQTTNENISGPVTEEELSHDYEPYWLGDHPNSVFNNTTLPANPLFVYPENHLVPKKEREFVARLCERKDISSVVIITKSAVMLSDFAAPCICVM